MLPRDERKALAKKHGDKTIGEFEEFMSLQQAVDDSDTTQQKAYDNQLIHAEGDKKPDLKRSPGKKKFEKKESEEDDDDSSVEERKQYNWQLSSGSGVDLSPSIEMGGQILMLHDEILHVVFFFLPVDAYGTLAVASPH